MTDTIVTADRLADRLRDTAAQLRRMQEIAKFGGDATGVRVKDPSLLLADLDEAVEALALRTPSEGRHTGADIDRAAHALENGTDLSLRWEELCIVADLVLSTFTSPQPEGLGVERRGIYIASKVAHAERWRDLRTFERDPIISTWIDEAGAGESSSLEDLWRRCVTEASNAGALIIYREPGEVLKGAWVELGSALANGVPVFAVGIEEFTVANHAGITHCVDMFEARRLACAALQPKE